MILSDILQDNWEERTNISDHNDDEEYVPYSIMTNNLPIIIESQSKKKKDQLKKNHYNVHIYQILPYPPNSKEPHNLSKHN